MALLYDLCIATSSGVTTLPLDIAVSETLFKRSRLAQHLSNLTAQLTQSAGKTTSKHVNKLTKTRVFARRFHSPLALQCCSNTTRQIVNFTKIIKSRLKIASSPSDSRAQANLHRTCKKYPSDAGLDQTAGKYARSRIVHLCIERAWNALKPILIQTVFLKTAQTMLS